MPTTYFRIRCVICDRRFETTDPQEENCGPCAEAIEAAMNREPSAYFSTAAVRGRLSIAAMSDCVR